MEFLDNIELHLHYEGSKISQNSVKSGLRCPGGVIEEVSEYLEENSVVSGKGGGLLTNNLNTSKHTLTRGGSTRQI